MRKSGVYAPFLEERQPSLEKDERRMGDIPRTLQVDRL